MIDLIGSFNFVAFAAANAVILVVGYVLIGIVFTFVKWTLSLFKIKRDLGNITEEDISKYASRWSNKSNEDAKTDLRRLTAQKTLECSKYPPTAKENAGWIAAWAIFWPFVILWTMLHDVVIEVSQYLVRKFQALYQKLATAILPE